ncbi:MAG TPA: hypothetical protein DCP91_05695, partial [Eggerthellaceae bacterium]|nr:hypothetical protein [Eggerthellaceae bacterium]
MADLATAYLRLIPSLQGAQRQIEKELAGVNTSSAGRKSGASYGEGVKGGIKGIAIGNFLGNILTSAATSAASMVGDVFADAFNNFAEFEQLEGGVEKIFDQADTSKIFSDAQNAYKE